MKRLKYYSGILILLLTLVSCGQDNPTSVKGKQDVTLENIATIDQQVTDLMAAYNIPGASLAISKKGKMVYSMQYGFANSAQNEQVDADHVFRIASCSKTFTAVAIMDLIQKGKLAMSDKVFGPGSIFGERFGSTPYSDRVLAITVESLLHHRFGGWGVSSGGDPIDYNSQMNDDEFIGYVLDNWPLEYEHDTRHVYSNMGYYLLARIIEEVSGKTYANYLSNDLLDDIPVKLHVTNFDRADRQPNEVEYYGQGNEQQFIYNIAPRRDGDAGVVISAEELLKFVNAIDGFATRPDVLNQETLKLFTTAPPNNANYAAGIGNWQEQNVWYHYGSLPGLRSAFMRHANGLNIVLLFNSRPAENHQQFVYDMQDLLLDILNNNQISYQNIDLFDD